MASQPVHKLPFGPTGSVPREQAPVPVLVPSHNASHIDGWGLCAPSVVLAPHSGMQRARSSTRMSLSEAPVTSSQGADIIGNATMVSRPALSRSPHARTVNGHEQQPTPLLMYFECAAYLTDRPTGDVFTGFCQVGFSQCCRYIAACQLNQRLEQFDTLYEDHTI